MQENKRNIELQLWEYIDEVCTDAEKQRIATLIRNDSDWAKMHHELLAFQQELKDINEVQEPHMRFTQNVMDAIAGMQPIPVMRSYINRSLMRGLAAFFIISIGLSLLAILFSTNWNTPVSIINLEWRLPKVELNSVFNAHSVTVGVSLLVMLTLVFVDQLLRVKRLKHN
jgi:hypothetical protein